MYMGLNFYCLEVFEMKQNGKGLSVLIILRPKRNCKTNDYSMQHGNKYDLNEGSRIQLDQMITK